jgi:hypothetical protein
MGPRIPILYVFTSAATDGCTKMKDVLRRTAIKRNFAIMAFMIFLSFRIWLFDDEKFVSFCSLPHLLSIITGLNFPSFFNGARIQ